MSDIISQIEFLFGPDDVVALVMLNGEFRGKTAGRTAIGFYTDRSLYKEQVDELNASGNLYCNLNRLHPDVIGRAHNRLQTFAPTRFTDSEIIRRRALLIDCDSVRLSGINATDDELHAAEDLASQVQEYLLDLWGVEPLRLMSGNGASLYFLIDEPTDTPLVTQVLAHLHARFSNDRAKIDTSVSDAARITRVAGALNMKGDSVPGRPRRIAHIVSLPRERIVVSTDQLLLLAPPDGNSGKSNHSAQSRSFAKGSWSHAKLLAFLKDEFQGNYKVITEPSKGYDDDTAYDLEKCPFIEHGDEPWKTRITLINGVPGFKCFHDSCSNPKKTFRDFREKFRKEPTLALTDELRLARHVLSQFSVEEIPAVRFYSGEWYLWDGIWRKQDEDTFTSQLYDTCKSYILVSWPKDAVGKDGKPIPAPKLGKASLTNVMLALKSLTTVQEAGWIDKRGGRWIAFSDNILSLDDWIRRESKYVPQTPEYFSPTALSYPLTYTEAEPTIFLEKLRDQVTESEVLALQEFGGYCMTTETSIQRILYMVGPPRSFKGTFERVLRATIGDHNAVSKTFSSFIAPHALENVPNKTFMGISDSRPDPRLSKQAVERLLSISGEDPQDINPKKKTPYTAKLVCKIGIASNIMADFADPTGALASRFLFIETTKSYASNPDPTLLDKILVEQNEITWWFLRGLQRLLQQGGYTDPTNTLDMKFQLLSKPIPAFVEARCVVTGTSDDRLNRDSLFTAFESWCEEREISNPPVKNVFFRDLYDAYPTVKSHDRNVSGIAFLAV